MEENGLNLVCYHFNVNTTIHKKYLNFRKRVWKADSMLCVKHWRTLYTATSLSIQINIFLLMSLESVKVFQRNVQADNPLWVVLPLSSKKTERESRGKV